MAVVAFILSAALMLPFFAWGIYTLRERYVLHGEIPRRVELATLAGVLAFCLVQLFLIRLWIGGVEVLYIFALLSLLVASTALYGPMFVSVASQAVVDLVHPPTEDRAHTPHFGPAEALEEVADFDGALREYMVLARIFPRHAETALRTGHAFAELGRYDEAVEALERGLAMIEEPSRALMITNRLSDIYLRRLDREEDSRRVLKAYLRRFPDGDRVQSVIKKLDRSSKLTAAERGNGASGDLDSTQGDRLE